MSTVSLDDPIDLENEKEYGSNNSNENEVSEELTVHRNDTLMFKGTKDKKSGAKNHEKSKKKNCKAIQDEAVQEKTNKG